MIFDKADFDSRISQFFSSYLINSQTQYMQNYFILLYFKADVGVGQKSALFPILLVLYITFIFYVFKKRTKNLSISISVFILLFINDDIFVSQEKSFENFNVILYCNYNIILSLFNQFGLVIVVATTSHNDQ